MIHTAIITATVMWSLGIIVGAPLLVLAAAFAYRRFGNWIGDQMLVALSARKLCFRCFFETRRQVPADWEMRVPGADDICPGTYCDACIRKEHALPLLEFAFRQGYVTPARKP